MFELPDDATSFDLYLCGASLSSVGFPPIGGCTASTVKGLLRSELDSKVIDESDLKKMKFTNSIFHALIRTSSLQSQHINKIKYHKKDIGPAQLKWYWSAEFANSPLQDPYNMHKPDVALFYYKNKHWEQTWADILSFVEYTSSNLAVMHDLVVYWGSATKVYLIIQEQPWCRFILAYSICADDLRAHYFDCLGLIISLPTPIHKFPIHVTEAVATTALANPQYLGLDPTIYMCIPDCQGTHSSLAVGAKGWDYAMKDCRVPEAKRYHKVDVLKRIKGIPNVIQLIHNFYQQFDPEDRDDHRFCNQFHRWIVMTPCEEPLSDFSSGKELICAFCDFIIGEFSSVQHVKFKCNDVTHGILHGDLSPNNFIIYEGIEYFIDFNHAGFIEKGKAFMISFGTGTIPYISMCVLKMMSRNAETMKKTADTTQLHPIEHHYGGAHGILTPTWDKLAMSWSDTYENLGASSLLTTFLSKKRAIFEGDFLMNRSLQIFLRIQTSS
ncbi:uncharacterized protein F5891DRAFT_1196557 [Suillus fuscotomentosus]|uniref:Fungal-type protein kinase domain-containing protein n=1 Tax=Suillus fuscotomentosus TaxID=1912939 RepID=A0AAD4DT20_9AGAM|nr:uncharacterized protein F5891DRAFT_1196557 [Suillus fuscotomentosus]KAG1893326.1 hypothetical protein F5891DRAFT_1196557 [Suillus fuscotomentosus]